MAKVYLSTNVYDESRKRIKYLFDNFPKIYLSFSGGKDSTVLFHLLMDEAKIRNTKIGVLFIDWECQLSSTIAHVKDMFQQYKDNIDIYWIQLPIKTTNGCSQIEPEWIAWDETCKTSWVRAKDPMSIKNKKFFPFYKSDMSFEEFISEFANWYSNNKKCAGCIGIRTDESFNRLKMISNRYFKELNNSWLTKSSKTIQYAYPLYDWSVEDVWTYNGKFKKMYNILYDDMYKAGLTLSQMRVDEPFGDTQRRGLWLYQVLEPRLWSKIIQRVSGANLGAIYGKSNGLMLGNDKIVLPKNHTWKSFTNFILDTMPKKSAEHYKNKIAVYLKWYKLHGYIILPDEGDMKNEKSGTPPSWQRICKCILKNDYWCISLGFSPTKQSFYDNYIRIMKNRRNKWHIYGDGIYGKNN